MRLIRDNRPTTNLVGQSVELRKPYHGYTRGRIVESIGRNFAGVPLYGLHLSNESETYSHAGQPITVDFAQSEFTGELAEAYREQFREVLESLA